MEERESSERREARMQGELEKSCYTTFVVSHGNVRAEIP